MRNFLKNDSQINEKSNDDNFYFVILLSHSESFSFWNTKPEFCDKLVIIFRQYVIILTYQFIISREAYFLNNN